MTILATDKLKRTLRQVGRMLQDPALMRQAMDAARNPALMREMMRNADRARANLESVPGGFDALQQFYTNVEQPLFDATNPANMEAGAAAAAAPGGAAAGGQQQGGQRPPNPWGASACAPVVSLCALFSHETRERSGLGSRGPSRWRRAQPLRSHGWCRCRWQPVCSHGRRR